MYDTIGLEHWILPSNANGCACVQNIAAENESVTLAEHVTHCRRDDIINVLIEYVTPLRLEHRIFSSSLISFPILDGNRWNAVAFPAIFEICMYPKPPLCKLSCFFPEVHTSVKICHISAPLLCVIAA